VGGNINFGNGGDINDAALAAMQSAMQGLI